MSQTTTAISASPSSCEEYYKKLHASCTAVLDATFAADGDRRQAASHGFVGDIEAWAKALALRPEAELFQTGLREYQFALLALVQGQYRQAFMALRLSFELLLGGVYLSANELELRVWLRGRNDLVWGNLIDEQTGVLSKRFIGAFFEDLADKAATYRVMAQALYRECSEYVHGNPPKSARLPDGVSFSAAVFADSHEKAKSLRLVVHFCLCARYLLVLDKTARAPLESVVLDALGHMPEIRHVFGAPVELLNV